MVDRFKTEQFIYPGAASAPTADETAKLAASHAKYVGDLDSSEDLLDTLLQIIKLLDLLSLRTASAELSSIEQVLFAAILCLYAYTVLIHRLVDLRIVVNRALEVAIPLVLGALFHQLQRRIAALVFASV